MKKRYPTSGLPFGIRYTDFCPLYFATGKPAPPDITAREYFGIINDLIPTTPGLSEAITVAHRWWKLESEYRSQFVDALKSAPSTIASEFTVEDKRHPQRRADFFNRLNEEKEILLFQKLWEQAPLEVRYGTLKNACRSFHEREKFYSKLAKFLGKNLNDFYNEIGLKKVKDGSTFNKKYIKHNICRIKISDEEKTIKKLELLFIIPETLNKLLLPQKDNLFSIEECKLFLLTKFKYLLSISTDQEKDFFVTQLNSFLEFWIREKKAPDRFSFHKNCSIKKSGDIIYIKPLGHLPVENSEIVKFRLDFKWRRYEKNFDLIKIKNEYFIEVPYISKKAEKPDNNTKLFFGAGMHKKGLELMCLTIDMHESWINKVAETFSKTNFFKSENKTIFRQPVSGGLPSLGKKQ